MAVTDSEQCIAYYQKEIGNTFHLPYSARLGMFQKFDVSNSVQVGHERVLEQSLVQMPFLRIETFTQSSGLKRVIISNIVIGIIPSRMILRLVTNSAFNDRYSARMELADFTKTDTIKGTNNGCSIILRVVTVALLKLSASETKKLR
ncbi:hypothetical protein CEXT_440251 [Caerostris extrusa]|uniref:Uncharacterized protein n=1 Tax=Caerostris extrusa TaxID=172846 RepID=A0AAV4PVS0_CAEEX|nr:hypothetical protein CEXT_440251 [Caerostris extrusa]